MVSLATPPSTAPRSTPTSCCLKRPRSDDSGVELSSSPPLKRPRVEFAENLIEVRIMEPWPAPDSLDLTRERLRKVLQRHLANDDGPYLRLQSDFTMQPGDENAPPSIELQLNLAALTANASMINSKCTALVHAILECQWLGRDETFITSYIRFLGNLISAQPGYTTIVLQRLVDYFEKIPSSAGRLPSHSVVSRHELRARVHHAIRYILRLSPSASGMLSSVLAASYPHVDEPVRSHTSYVENMLSVAEYVPELKCEILALAVERVVKIDVEIQCDLDELEEEEEDLLNAAQDHARDAHHATHILDLEETDDESDEEFSDEESIFSEDEDDSAERRIENMKKAMNKVDSILDLIFGYYNPAFSKNASALEAEEMFDHLLAQFSNVLLPVHRSRHTQFLIFHLAQTSNTLIERFAGACTHIALDHNRPNVTRLSAAAYLGSFLARGARVPREFVRAIYLVLTGYLDKFLRSHEVACTGPDPTRYTGYYGVAQALLYIFCFRWRDLVATDSNDSDDEYDAEVADGHELTWIPGIKETLSRNIYSKLNPLKVCSPAIVTQFARIAHHLKFLYVFPKLETNKRIRLCRTTSLPGANNFGMPERGSALTRLTDDKTQQLDAHFPFDPYQLPKSLKWMKGDYNEWKGLPGLDDEEDEGGATAYQGYPTPGRESREGSEATSE